MDKKTLETVQNAKFPDTPEGNILADSILKSFDRRDRSDRSVLCARRTAVSAGSKMLSTRMTESLRTMSRRSARRKSFGFSRWRERAK